MLIKSWLHPASIKWYKSFFGPNRTILKKVVPIISTKNVLNGKGVVTSHSTVDGGGVSFLSFSSPFLSSFSSYFFRFLHYFLFYRPIFGPYRANFWALPHYFQK